MLRVALTGGIGSGKTTVANLFADLGIDIIDADKIAHAFTAPEQPATKTIIEHFGPEIADEHHQLHRKKLAKIIFQHPKEKKWLENLLHPLVIEEMKQQTKKSHSPYCILAIPLLLESNLTKGLYDRILVLDIPEALQLKRTKERDELTENQIKAIMATQVTRDERLAAADDVIDNSGDVASLVSRVAELDARYRI